MCKVKMQRTISVDSFFLNVKKNYFALLDLMFAIIVLSGDSKNIYET